MMPVSRSILRNSAVLAAFALLTTAAVATLVWATSGRVAENQRQARLDALAAVMPAALHDNDLLAETRQVSDPLLGDARPHTVWIARREGMPTGLVVEAVAPEGYGGTIRLLVGIREDGAITGVRVVPPHAETPGLGDRIDIRKSGWILSFNDRSLANTGEAGWAVKKDGGEFDQFTGATITPRAVVRAVHNSLRWFGTQRDTLLDASGETP